MYVSLSHATLFRSPSHHFLLPLPLRSTPKKRLTLQEIAVALIASFLGGVGTVAMFCTLGIYVSVEQPFELAQLLGFGVAYVAYVV